MYVCMYVHTYMHTYIWREWLLRYHRKGFTLPKKGFSPFWDTHRHRHTQMMGLSCRTDTHTGTHTHTKTHTDQDTLRKGVSPSWHTHTHTHTRAHTHAFFPFFVVTERVLLPWGFSRKIHARTIEADMCKCVPARLELERLWYKSLSKSIVQMSNGPF